ncbi:VOC family protein [Nesterenkonia sandarakina]|uniref:Putative glyoxalase superfamily protein PhnB n=1 Tax=Nesterenkonia sandarakina TaxID=272918 RepID=A0A7Z0EA75_9MICC|nr:VOC family protein [Nesterenkonia sandarakina]NYJ17799.1 putative glyoxalase superfamily protein PhnB [Nesterenkonia sandarakina]
MAAVLVPYLSYADPAGVIDWLQAIGFRVLARHDDPAGRVVHAELGFGEAVVMLASNDADYLTPPLIARSTGVGLYLALDDVAERYAAAIDAGASSVLAPEETEWGTQRARVLGPGGREWSFGSYLPGAAR